MATVYKYFILLISFLWVACSGKGSTSTGNNTTIETILSRKSVRTYMDNRPIKEADVQLMLRAGMAAPSGRDIRPWEIIVIDDRQKLDEMGNQLRTAGMLKDAPLAFIICGDSIKSFYWYLDCAAVTQNILLAAESLGLGAVWTASYPYEDRMEVVAKTIGLPSHILPLAVVPVGYPEGKTSTKDKFDTAKIHYNTW